MAQIIPTLRSAANTVESIGNFIDSPLGHTIRTGCGLSYAAGAGALTSVIIGSSLGAAGGAVFGATGWLVNRSVNWICDKALKGMNLSENTAAKTMAFVLKFFMTTGACVGAAMLAGFPITFTAGAILSLATSVVLPAITIMVIVSVVAPWLISLAQWAQSRAVQLQTFINQVAPDQNTIEAGAGLINNELLADVSPETVELFREMDASIFQFISTKAAFIYSVGPRRNEEIPDYFQETTKGFIRILRNQINNEEIIAQVRPFITDFAQFQGEEPQNLEVKALFNQLRNIGSREMQGNSLLNTRCYQRALELVPR
ncbi:MAG TPA: hypothetical protein VHL30_02275 [Chlamydiales bacterium]|jgi:hypothetical protein|nr:hypothetical protein [Chlamydiales bacterium]